MSLLVLVGLLVVGIVGNVIAARVGALGLWTLGEEGDNMDDGLRTENSGKPASPSSPSLFYAVGPSTPREPSRFEVLSAAIARNGRDLSLASLGYLVREGKRRSREGRGAA